MTVSPTEDDSSHFRSEAYSAVATYLSQQEDLHTDPEVWRVEVLGTLDYSDAAAIIHDHLIKTAPVSAIPSVDDLERAFRRHAREYLEAKEDALQRFRDAAGIAMAEDDGIREAEARLAVADTEHWKGIHASAYAIARWSSRHGHDDINGTASFVVQLIEYDGDTPLDDALVIADVRKLAKAVRAAGDREALPLAENMERLALLIAGPEPLTVRPATGRRPVAGAAPTG